MAEAARATLVDADVLLDVLTQDLTWFDWSAAALARAAGAGRLVVNPVVDAEVSVRFSAIEEVDDALPSDLPPGTGPVVGGLPGREGLRRVPAARRRPALTAARLLIGAHAAVQDLRLLTRHAARYRTYFPTLEVVAPG